MKDIVATAGGARLRGAAAAAASVMKLLEVSSPEHRLLPQRGSRPASATRLASVGSKTGHCKNEDLDYVPMPKKVVSEIEKLWAKEIKDASRTSSERQPRSARHWRTRTR